MRIDSQPTMQFADDLEPRLEKKDEEPNKGVKNLVLYYSNKDYESVFNMLNAKMVGRNDFVFCAGQCYYYHYYYIYYNNYYYYYIYYQ